MFGGEHFQTFRCNHLRKTCTFLHEKCHDGRELGQFLSTFMALKGKKLPMTFKILLKVLFVRKVDFAVLLPAQCVSIWRAEKETQKSSFLTDRTFFCKILLWAWSFLVPSSFWKDCLVFMICLCIRKWMCKKDLYRKIICIHYLLYSWIIFHQ